MAKKYFHSEVLEFQNGDTTVAKQLTIKKLRALTEVISDFEKHQMGLNKRVSDYVAAAAKKGVDPEEATRQVSEEIDSEDHPTYLDMLQAGTLIALNQWGVKDSKSKSIQNIDDEYIEETLDYPTMQRIVEIAGSL